MHGLLRYLLTWLPPCGLYITELGCQQHAEEKRNGQDHTQRQSAKHLAAALAVILTIIVFTHHEEQGAAQARKNRQKGENDHEFHERIIWCALLEFQTSGGLY